ncbi:MAG: dihydroorotate dehydrogenase electron transfer subunit [Clostridiales bacterium]|nr:dihydroorotate dehydrogenase electron transfer subunit [Clostridiales bacterium]
MKAVKAELRIKNIEKHGQNLYRVECEADSVLPRMAAGQFAHIKVPNKDLRRPICIYDRGEHAVCFIIADVGEGTAAFTAQKAGAEFDALLPLGNGFPVLPDKTNIALLGGGTGCAPLLKIAKDNPSLNCTALLGFPNAAAREVYKDDFDKYCKKVCYCTDDGSLGYHGYPTELLTEIAPEVIYVCGAPGLMRTAQRFCKDRGVIGFASTEQRMGCGVGACLVCSVKVMREGKEKLLRACADGPVFPIEELVL